MKYISWGVKPTNDGRYMVVNREGRVDSLWDIHNNLDDAIKHAKIMGFGAEPFVEV